MRCSTRSFKGALTDLNSDCAGAVFDGDRGLIVVTDGTARPGSDQLAQSFVTYVIETYRKWLSAGDSDASPDAARALLGKVVSEIHGLLFRNHTGTCCYLVGVISNGYLTVAYEGDCSCGLVSAQTVIEWLTPPHCQANWKRDKSHKELAQDPARNFITRCCKANAAPRPDFVNLAVEPGQRLVFATDGFWADLDAERQGATLNSAASEHFETDDDVTWVDVWL